jgi:CubicO group peptidase (beta-lactamase class C family)
MLRLALAIGIVLLLPLDRAPMRAAEQLVHPFPDALVLFTQYLDSLRVQAGIPGLAAAIAGPDRLLWERGFGHQDLERGIPASPDTPFHLDGLTQPFAAAIALRCVEEGRISLDEPISGIVAGSAEPNATTRQLLTHTLGSPSDPVYEHRMERVEALGAVIDACSGHSFREALMELFDALAMVDSVPGPDAVRVLSADPGDGMRAVAVRYARVLDRLAVPYAVDSRRRARPSEYSSQRLTTTGGLVSTVRDFALFDVALRNGLILRSSTLEAAWQPALGAGGNPLPHGYGWFVQPHGGQRIVWQFGVQDASSSLVMTLPDRGLTLILLANSSGLVRPFPLAAGDVTVSPFARLFLGLFAR